MSITTTILERRADFFNIEVFKHPRDYDLMYDNPGLAEVGVHDSYESGWYW